MDLGTPAQAESGLWLITLGGAAKAGPERLIMGCACRPQAFDCSLNLKCPQQARAEAWRQAAFTSRSHPSTVPPIKSQSCRTRHQ